MRHFRIVFPAVTLPARVAGLWEALRKKFEKTFGKIWKIAEKVLTFAAVFRKGPAAGRGPLPKKNRKNFRKNLEDNQKSPYLCSRFPAEPGSRKKSDL